MPSELLKKQFLFLQNIAALVIHATQLKARLAVGEFYVKDTVEHIRKKHPGIDTVKSPHREDGGHFNRVAGDLMLHMPRSGQIGHVPPDEVEYDWIDGEHVMWHELGRYWKSLHPDNRWGGDFVSKDYNHFSMLYGGIA